MDQSVVTTRPSWPASLIVAYAIIAIVLTVVGVMAYTLPPDRGAAGNALVAITCTVPLIFAVIAVGSAWRHLTRP